MKTYYVYILANKKRGILYVGVTSDLTGRVWEHKSKVLKGFTSKYHVNILVYWEEFRDILDAIYREKRLKRWNREYKYRLIEKDNPNWDDLYLQYTFISK